MTDQKQPSAYILVAEEENPQALHFKWQYRIIVNSLAGSWQLAEKLAKNLRGGMLVGLEGELGAGKTEFVRGLFSVFGMADEVSSPTFVFQMVYELPLEKRSGYQFKEICHWDLYRATSDEFLPEFIDSGVDLERLTLIEWSNRIAELENLLSIKIMLANEYALESEKREITLFSVVELLLL